MRQGAERGLPCLGAEDRLHHFALLNEVGEQLVDPGAPASRIAVADSGVVERDVEDVEIPQRPGSVQ